MFLHHIHPHYCGLSFPSTAVCSRVNGYIHRRMGFAVSRNTTKVRRVMRVPAVEKLQNEKTAAHLAAAQVSTAHNNCIH